MSGKSKKSRGGAAKDFAEQAEQQRPGLFREFRDFVLYSKKWWLIPILVVLVLLGILIALGPSTPLGPFIYTLF